MLYCLKLHVTGWELVSGAASDYSTSNLAETGLKFNTAVMHQTIIPTYLGRPTSNAFMNSGLFAKR